MLKAQMIQLVVLRFVNGFFIGSMYQVLGSLQLSLKSRSPIELYRTDTTRRNSEVKE
jgi:hypothetical protein